MKHFQATPLFDVKNALGEGPLWHPKENRLYWTDILSGDLYQTNSELSSYQRYHFPFKIGAFAFTKDGGFILARDKGFYDLKDLQSKPTLIWNPLLGRDAVRLNDGKVDPSGRFWAGSMDIRNQNGALYRLDPDGIKRIMLENIGISNGLGWSPDHKQMYYTDSLQYTIYRFDYELKTGAITHKESFIQLPRDDKEIVPDGLCVDAEGNIWSAQWNGWQVVKYDPQGNPLAIVQVPAQRVTSCCFGGKNLDILFITTSRSEFSEEELINQPHAGDIFKCKVDTQGQLSNLYG
jgi:sugar lactone lactonase YvrE